MKIVIYDPLYSKIGHFSRYNRFLVQLICSIDSITEITVIAEHKELEDLRNESSKVKVVYVPGDMHSMQQKLMQAKGFAKLGLLRKSFSNYRRIISMINNSDTDLVLFASSGQLGFWLSGFLLKKRYAVSAISIKWLYKGKGFFQPLYHIYRKFLASANLILFTEEMYKTKAALEGLKVSEVFPDRYLESLAEHTKADAVNSNIQLVTIGTISAIKNPLTFLEEWKAIDKRVTGKFAYCVYGKVMDDSADAILEAVHDCENVVFKNDYISAEEYNSLMKKADFVVIPYSSDYTKYATSGVMWDCFQAQKAILCPDIEPFRYYIQEYGVGYLYTPGKLETTLNRMQAEKDRFRVELPGQFARLIEQDSFDNIKSRLESSLKKYFSIT